MKPGNPDGAKTCGATVPPSDERTIGSNLSIFMRGLFVAV
jgi:hypothetical protein